MENPDDEARLERFQKLVWGTPSVKTKTLIREWRKIEHLVTDELSYSGLLYIVLPALTTLERASLYEEKQDLLSRIRRHPDLPGDAMPDRDLLDIWEGGNLINLSRTDEGFSLFLKVASRLRAGSISSATVLCSTMNYLILDEKIDPNDRRVDEIVANCETFFAANQGEWKFRTLHRLRRTLKRKRSEVNMEPTAGQDL